MGKAERAEFSFRFRLQSHSGRTPYDVRAEQRPERLRLTCTCRTARSGYLCEHRLKLTLGDGASLIDGGDRLNEFLELISRTPLPKAVQELVRLKRERDFILEEIRRQERFVVELMEG